VLVVALRRAAAGDQRDHEAIGGDGGGKERLRR
jgi:hypothetical protein